MEPEDIERQISTEEEEQERTLKEMDQVILETQPEMVAAATSALDYLTIESIKENPSRALELDVEGLRELRGRVDSLRPRLAELCEVRIGHRGDWPHRRDPPLSDAESKRARGYFSEVFVDLVSPLGSVLDDFGLIADDDLGKRSWKRVRGSSDQWRLFIHGFLFTDHPMMRKYGDLEEEYKNRVRRIGELRYELQQAKALEAWDLSAGHTVDREAPEGP